MRKVQLKIYDKFSRKWSNEFILDGIFHQWGVAYEEFESGPGNHSVAIVEMPDGTIRQILPENLKFTDARSV